MKIATMLMAAAFVPFMAMAQTNETVKATRKQAVKREGQVFIFPDNVRFSKNELNARVAQKTKELTRHMKILAEKKDRAYRSHVEEAMKLFNNNDKVLVTYTSKSKPEPTTVPVRQYLSRLAQLQYDNVTVNWTNAQYLSKFTRQPDGTYKAIVAYEQEFTGQKGGEANYVYHDVTQKRIEVGVKVWDAPKDSTGRKAYMDVFLGNIGVTEE